MLEHARGKRSQKAAEAAVATAAAVVATAVAVATAAAAVSLANNRLRNFLCKCKPGPDTRVSL